MAPGSSSDTVMRPLRQLDDAMKDDKVEPHSPRASGLTPEAKKPKLSLGEALSMIGDDVAMTDGTRAILAQEPGLVAALHCDDFEELDIDDEEYDEAEYHDEMTGAQLSSEAVHKARAEELAYYKSFDAYVEVDETECYEHTGTGPISCR